MTWLGFFLYNSGNARPNQLFCLVLFYPSPLTGEGEKSSDYCNSAKLSAVNGNQTWATNTASEGALSVTPLPR